MRKNLYSLCFLLLALTAFFTHRSYAQYCTPTFTTGTTSGDFIDGVILNTISNTGTGGSVPPYTDYSATLSTTLIPSTTYTITFNNNPTWTEGYEAWIDYNQNQSFEPSESLGTISLAGGATGSLNFTVPATASPGTTRLRVMCEFASTFPLDPCTASPPTWGEVEDYGIVIPASADDDVGITGIDDISGCSMGVANITATIFNFGTNPVVDSFTMGYQIDDPVAGLQPAVFETYTGPTISSFSSEDFTFATTYDFSNLGFYDITVWAIYTLDSTGYNDTLTIQVENAGIPSISSFPYFQDFEGGQAGWLPGGTGGVWQFGSPNGPIISGAPPSTPSSNNSWATNLTGTYNNNDNSFIIGPCFDFSSLVLPEILLDIWWNSENSWDGTKLQSSTDGGITWQDVGSTTSGGDNWYTDATILGLQYTGTQQGWTGIGPGGWVTAKHDLTGLAGNGNVFLRIAFGSDGSVTGFDGVAFDNVLIRDKPDKDVGISHILSPLTSCLLDSAEEVTVVIHNYGIADQWSFDVNYQISGGTIVTETVTDTVLVADSLIYQFATTADLATGGAYQVKAWTSLAGDQGPINDTLQVISENLAGAALTLPISDNFDSYVDGATVFDDYINSTDDDLDWEVNFGPTTSTATGPAFDASGSGNYIYMETSGSQVGDQTKLTTECIDLTNGLNPRIEFAYHMYGAAIGSLSVDIIAGGSVTNGLTLTGQQHLGNNAPWTYATVDLTPFLGEYVQICITGEVGTGGSTFESDIALDEITIEDPVPNDLGVIEVTSPVSNCILDTAETITVIIENFGTLDQWDFPVSYQIDGGPVFTETIADTLVADGDTMSFTFSTNADLSTEGLHIIKVWTDLAIEEAPHNDTAIYEVTHIPTISTYPYVQDFETPTHGWVSGGNESSWELGTPFGLFINTASSGANSWVTNLSGGYNDNEQSYVLSPCFDFSMLNSPGVVMDAWWEAEGGVDGAVLQSTIDQGASWKRVGSAGDDDNWYTSNNVIGNPGGQTPGAAEAHGWTNAISSTIGSFGWNTARHAVDGLGGAPLVQFRVAFGSNSATSNFDGFAFDDFIITEMPVVNLGPDTSYCGNSIIDAENVGSTIQWSTGETSQTINVAVSGEYHATATGPFGFTSSDTITMVIRPYPTVNLGTEIFTCGQHTLDALNPGAEYLWSTGDTTQLVTVSSSGLFYVDVTVEKCTTRDSVMVDVNAAPIAGFTFTSNTGVVTFSNDSENAVHYQWHFGDGNQDFQKDPVHTYPESGVYTITLIAINNCGSDTVTEQVTLFISGIEDMNLDNNISIFPNPTSAVANVNFSAIDVNELTITLLNVVGQKVWQSETVKVSGSWQKEIDLGAFPAGTYLLKVQADDQTVTKTIVKQ